MSAKPDPFHLGEGLMSPIWLQDSVGAGAAALPQHTPSLLSLLPLYLPLKDAAPSFSQLQDYLLFLALAFCSAAPFSLFSSLGRGGVDSKISHAGPLGQPCPLTQSSCTTSRWGGTYTHRTALSCTSHAGGLPFPQLLSISNPCQNSASAFRLTM